MKKSPTFMIKSLVATVIGFSLSAVCMAKDEPPQIKEYQEERPVWNTSNGFGPIPKGLQQVGDAACQKVKYDRAVGYSKKTLDPDGNSFQKGGFMCQMDPKSNS